MGNQKKLLTKNFTIDISNVDVDSRIISGYASTFNTIDADGDLIVKGAFAKTLMENGVESANPRIFHLYQHDITQVLGRPTKLIEDDKGLYFETQIANTSLGNDVLQLYKEGVINEHSIGFQTVKSTNRGSYNEIQEVKLFEFSTVTFGANANTPFLGFKSQFSDQESITSQFDKVSKMLKGDITPETAQLLTIYLNQFKTAFLDLSIKAVEALDPLEDSLEDVNPLDIKQEIEVKNNDAELLESFFKGYNKKSTNN
ncbi:HK97 family phage prohead protease [Pedobacter immunditicola]|uniref:HK97 family phage prohead protease n=1 Tax=Pedobacter immunditicola TaxID=3133440 RepID=UPI003094B079